MAALPTQILSLCSGIGGLDLGVAAALRGNCRTVCYVESEAFAAGVLAARSKDGQLDDAPVWSDVATFDPEPWRGHVHAIIGGYPCQPISVAGRRQGTTDGRWLWPHIARIVDDLKPQWCFFENVANHVNLGLETVYGDLCRMGFDVAAGLFEAAESGACHLRRRLFIFASTGKQWLAQAAQDGKKFNVADANGIDLRQQHWRCETRRQGEAQPAQHGKKRNVADASDNRQQGRRTIKPKSETFAATHSGQDVADTLGSRYSQRQSGEGQKVGHQAWLQQFKRLGGNVADASSERGRESQSSAWRWIADTDWVSHWRSSAGICRVVDGPAEKLDRIDRLRALGNAVVPACAAQALTELAGLDRDIDGQLHQPA